MSLDASDLVRTWVTDARGLADVSFEWHEFAKLWQTPGAGEEFCGPTARTAHRPSGRDARGGRRGPPSEAEPMAARIDRTMADAILALYRATRSTHAWGPAFESIAKPGMVVIPSDDPFLNEPSARRAGERSGARIEKLDGLGHWWILQDPPLAAQTLESLLERRGLIRFVPGGQASATRSSRSSLQ